MSSKQKENDKPKTNDSEKANGEKVIKMCAEKDTVKIIQKVAKVKGTDKVDPESKK
jgi:hypothetical protein